MHATVGDDRMHSMEAMMRAPPQRRDLLVPIVNLVCWSFTVSFAEDFCERCIVSLFFYCSYNKWLWSAADESIKVQCHLIALINI